MKTKNIDYLSIVIISILFLLIFSEYTVPYNTLYSIDHSIFTLLGRGINHDIIPYKDLFDHKGPVLYFIYALGDFINHRKIGLLILQIINLSFTLILIYKTAKLYLSDTFAKIIIPIFLFAFVYTIGGGGLTEEWSLPWLFLVNYLSIKSIKSNEYPYKYTILYAMCFSVVFYIRANNVALIAGVMTSLTIIFCVNQKFKILLKHIIIFLATFLICSLPIFIYFYHHEAIQEFIYSSFIFNFIYASEGTIDSSTRFIKYTWALSLLLLMLFTIIKKNISFNIKVLLFFPTIFSILSVSLGFAYAHYYTLLLPLYITFIILTIFILKNDRKTNTIISSITILVITLYPLYSHSLKETYRLTIYKYLISKPQTNQSVIYNTILSYIPQNERNSMLTFCTTIDSNIYTINDLFPPYKYFYLQNRMMERDDKIKEEIINYLQSSPPQYIIHSQSIQCELIENVLSKKYIIIYTVPDSDTKLYKLK